MTLLVVSVTMYTASCPILAAGWLLPNMVALHVLSYAILMLSVIKHMKCCHSLAAGRMFAYMAALLVYMCFSCMSSQRW